MDDPIAVNVLDGLEHLPGQIARMFFRVDSALAQPVKNVSTARQFQDKVEGLRLLEEVNQVDDAIVATTQRFQDGNLPINRVVVLLFEPLPIDQFHGEFRRGYFVRPNPHRCEAAGIELAVQGVQIVESNLEAEDGLDGGGAGIPAGRCRVGRCRRCIVPRGGIEGIVAGIVVLLRFATAESEERRGEEVLLLTTPIGAGVVDDHDKMMRVQRQFNNSRCVKD